MSKIDTNIIFASPITSTILNDKKLNKSLITYINKERKKPGRVLSNEGGYQTKNVNLNHPTIKKFIKAIAPSVQQHIDFYKFKTARTFKVLDLWFNINGKNHFNYDHSHMGGGCDLSAAYYITVHPNSGDIHFKNPDIGAHSNGMSDLPVKEFNPFNQAYYFYTPKETQLLVFSSALEHRVKPNLNKRERITLSFNIRVI
mgnify:FL=1|jgi:uncharacterized protein (TIGR02466 family)